MTNLADASKIRLGTGDASRVYAGSSWAWPKQTPMLPGLVVWLDASKLNLANGAAVTRWPNLGGGPSPAILGSPAPTFRTNALNGLPVVRITATQGKFRFTGTGVHKDYTLAYVGRKWTMKDGRVISSNMSTAGVGNILWGFWSTRFECAYVDGWMIPDDIISATTQWRLYSGDTTATGTARLFSNGTLLRTHPSPPAAGGLGGTLNISGQNDTEEACDCEIAEFMLYNRKLADAERQQIENYLRAKWNPIQPFTPLDLAENLLGWFDGKDASTVQIAGSGVNNWVNKSGGAMSLTQSDNAGRPTYASQTLTFTSPQRLQAANSPTAFDYIVVGKPLPPSAPEHRTLLRGAPSTPTHQMLLEPGNAMVAIWNGGFFPAGSYFIPTMTSNSAPSPYVASASSAWDDATNYYPFRAFDSDQNTCWHTHSSAPTPGWIKIDLGVSRYVGYYRIQARYPNTYNAWKNWVLEGSNNDSSWSLVDTVNNEPNFSAGEERLYKCDSINSYRYYRWTVSASWSTHAEAGALRLYEILTWDSVWGIGCGQISSSAPAMLSRDGGPMMSTGTTYAAADTAVASVGGLPGGGQPWGDVREIIFFAYNSPQSHRQMLEGYLAHKWGLTGLLPANHPYKTVAP